MVNKKILVSILILILNTILSAKIQKNNGVYSSKNIQALQDNFSSIFFQMERDFETQGWKDKPIQFKKFMVIVNIDNFTQAQVFLYKHIAAFIGRAAITTTDNLLVIGSSNIKIDAIYLKEKLNSNYLSTLKHKAHVIDNTKNEIYIATPIVYKTIFNKIKKEIQDNIKVKVLAVDKVTYQKLANKSSQQRLAKIYTQQKPPKKSSKFMNKKIENYTFKTNKRKITAPTFEEISYFTDNISDTAKPVRYILRYGEIQALGIKKGYKEDIKDGIKESTMIPKKILKNKSIYIEKIFVSDANIKYGKISGTNLFVDMEFIKRYK
jgi:hypothetical protein